MKNILLLVSIALSLFSIESSAGQRLPCYQSQRIPFNMELTYRAIKHMLVRSNFVIEHSEVSGQLISANGFFKLNEDTGKFVHITIIYEDLGNDITLVTLAGTYSDLEERSEIITAGAGSVTLPIPLFFRKNVAVEKSGTLTDPNIFRIFYLNVYNAIIETEVNYIKDTSKAENQNKPVKTLEVKDVEKKITTDPIKSAAGLNEIDKKTIPSSTGTIDTKKTEDSHSGKITEVITNQVKQPESKVVVENKPSQPLDNGALEVISNSVSNITPETGISKAPEPVPNVIDTPIKAIEKGSTKITKEVTEIFSNKAIKPEKTSIDKK